MVIMSQFRPGDRVLIAATDEFLAHVDGWRGRVAVVGPKQPNACHSQVPEGFALVEVIDGDGAKQFYVPFDQLRLTV
ncbi:hypothetical protein [Paraburkholderia fungorum]|uniref:hypothetical protein n=1 Tax=Paraburkholderia fungorum TaxID=134537 RepID=UPI002096E67A|nr:hypothetical protein [Paraburkholderia fungorum]